MSSKVPPLVYPTICEDTGLTEGLLCPAVLTLFPMVVLLGKHLHLWQQLVPDLWSPPSRSKTHNHSPLKSITQYKDCAEFKNTWLVLKFQKLVQNSSIDFYKRTRGPTLASASCCWLRKTFMLDIAPNCTTTVFQSKTTCHLEKRTVVLHLVCLLLCPEIFFYDQDGDSSCAIKHGKKKLIGNMC